MRYLLHKKSLKIMHTTGCETALTKMCQTVVVKFHHCGCALNGRPKRRNRQDDLRKWNGERVLKHRAF
jgi:hypothetical protein